MKRYLKHVLPENIYLAFQRFARVIARVNRSNLSATEINLRKHRRHLESLLNSASVMGWPCNTRPPETVSSTLIHRHVCPLLAPIVSGNSNTFHGFPFVVGVPPSQARAVRSSTFDPGRNLAGPPFVDFTTCFQGVDQRARCFGYDWIVNVL